MNRKSENTKISRFLSLILRHKPEAANIILDEHGWADVGELLFNLQKKYDICFNNDYSLIRANQGHSIPVDVELKKRIPPNPLFHGTALKSVKSIDKQGLLPMSRLYVHLSKDIPTAVQVGKRHGKPFVYSINTKKMIEDGLEFFLSENGIRLTKTVPPKYLSYIKK